MLCPRFWERKADGTASRLRVTKDLGPPVVLNSAAGTVVYLSNWLDYKCWQSGCNERNQQHLRVLPVSFTGLQVLLDVQA